MTTRRGFLGALLAAAVAPAIVRASSLMPIYVPKIILPSYLTLWGDGVHDDQHAIQTLLAGGLVADKLGRLIEQQDGVVYLPVGSYALGRDLNFTKDTFPIVAQSSYFEAMRTFPEGESLISDIR
jgi:hypothetical protein